MAFSIEQRILVIEVYFVSKSYKIVWERFREEYPGFQTLKKSSIKRLADDFWKEGCDQIAMELQPF